MRLEGWTLLNPLTAIVIGVAAVLVFRAVGKARKRRAGTVRDYALPLQLPWKFSPNGGAKEIRTPDLFDANEALYQLSYSPETTPVLRERRCRCP